MNKSVLIAGCGVSGQGAARLAAARGMTYSLIDEKDTEELRSFAKSLSPAPQNLFFGWQEGIPLPRFDQVILSPGIRRTTPLFHAIKACTDSISGELEFALSHWHKPFAGITGTNGKTTTTELTALLLQAAGIKADAFGNIGRSLCDAVCAADDLEFAVLEVSSFQLESMDRIKPKMSALLNIASDHIDRHGSMNAYLEAKCKLLRDSELPPVINGNLRSRMEKFLPEQKNFLTFSAIKQDTDFTLSPNGSIQFHGTRILHQNELKLQGTHNIENVMAALALTVQAAGTDILHNHKVMDVLYHFQPAAHRLEKFLTRDGILYIDDSKATNPHAVNAAVKAVGKGKNIRILLGGLDKDMDFTELSASKKHIIQAYLFGSCRERIGKAVDGMFPCTDCGTFVQAAEAACKDAKSGEIVLLSPATASMDEFKNYKERGLTFQRFVRQFLNR